MKTVHLASVCSLIFAGVVVAFPLRHATAATPPTPLQNTVRVTLYATTTPIPSSAPGASPSPGGATSRANLNLLSVNRPIPRPAGLKPAPLAPPAPPSNGITSSGASGFNGLTQRDQQLAGTGQYTLSQQFLEPPDQGLCIGNNSVVEAINLAMRVYTPTGSPTSGVTALNQFFQVPPEASATNPTTYGPFLSDPRCYYDTATARWFMSVLESDTDPATGAFTNTSSLLLAVSQSSDALGQWNLYRFYTTDDGTNGTPVHPGCPCFGDQPLLGADRYGIYLSTNEFPTFAAGFNGAQLYAISKAQLEAGTASRAVQIDTGVLPTPDPGGIWYSVQPATSPTADQFATGANGTEYALSALDFFGTGDNRVAAWALTNTASLDAATPLLHISTVIVPSETYVGFTPSGAEMTMGQKPGPTPLAHFFNFYFHTSNQEEPVQGNDDRMNQVVYAAGKLWSGVNTTENGIGVATNVGIAYFIVAPSVISGTLQATMARQGYVSAGRDNVAYPSIGVTPAGKGVMSFSLIGPDFYPSAAYVPVDVARGAGTIHLAALGTAPDDGFTGYNSPICPAVACNNQTGGRWGDYSAAVSDAAGTVWLAAEYIPNLPRLLFANWGTFIRSVTP